MREIGRRNEKTYHATTCALTSTPLGLGLVLSLAVVALSLAWGWVRVLDTTGVAGAGVIGVLGFTAKAGFVVARTTHF